MFKIPAWMSEWEVSFSERQMDTYLWHKLCHEDIRMNRVMSLAEIVETAAQHTCREN